MSPESRISRKPLSNTDKIIGQAGIAMVEIVRDKYAEYLEKPNKKNALEYCKWRLRLHRKLNNDQERLEAINNARTLGLYDENPGPLCFDLSFDDAFLRREW